MKHLERPKVLVLLAAYNGKSWIDEQLNSILDQKDVEVTVYVSVDASSDGTEGWVDKAAELDHRVNCLSHGKRFGGAARNFYRLVKEVDFSEFDFISLSDQDDVWLPFKLSRACDVLRAREYEGYSSNVTAFWPDGRRQLVDKAQTQKQWDYLFEAAGPGCTYVMTKQLAEQIKGHLQANEILDQVRLHDWLFYAIARSHGFRWFIDGQSTMLYRQHGRNQVGVNHGLKALCNRVNMFCSGRWISQSAIIASSLPVSDEVFVRSLVARRRDLFLRLALAAATCRRRRRDQAAFFVFCLMLFVGSLFKAGGQRQP